MEFDWLSKNQWWYFLTMFNFRDGEVVGLAVVVRECGRKWPCHKKVLNYSALFTKSSVLEDMKKESIPFYLNEKYLLSKFKSIGKGLSFVNGQWALDIMTILFNKDLDLEFDN